MSFVVFLDVDGVLNTRTTTVGTPSGAYTGVDDRRVMILSGAMKKTGAAGVVLTSTWKNLRSGGDDYTYLIDSLKKYDIDVIGETTDERISQREIGILNYLKQHSEVDEFVILDDNKFGFEDYDRLWERFLDTHGRGIADAEAASDTPAIETLLFLDAIDEVVDFGL